MSELNITPLLDLAFVLLIIFVITTPLLENAIDIHLPSARSQSSQVDPDSVKTVTVDKNGGIFLERSPITLSQLDATLTRWKRENPNVAVVLRADRDVRYQKLVDVFDAFQRAKVTKMGLVNNPEEKK